MTGAGRAYTYINRGRAILGNAWAAREWNAFLGNTASLRQRQPPIEWVQQPGAEIEVELDGTLLGPMALGAPEWSDECNEFGAALVARRESGLLAVEIRSFAFHRLPGFVRELRVWNTGPIPVCVRRVVLDALVLPRGCTPEAAPAADCMAFAQAGAALLLGGEPGARPAIEPAEPGNVALTCGDARKIEPAARAGYPAAYALPISGGASDAAETAYAALLAAHNRLREWAAGRAAESK